MPYIDENKRKYYELLFDINSEAVSPGDLNYIITKFCNSYLLRKEGRYRDYNEVIGVLECAKLEFYRRMVAPYEDASKIKNGDVYEFKSNE